MKFDLIQVGAYPLSEIFFLNPLNPLLSDQSIFVIHLVHTLESLC